MKLYIGNLSYKTTDEDLNQLFSEAGEVKSAEIMKDKLIIFDNEALALWSSRMMMMQRKRLSFSTEKMLMGES